jgi:DNA-binding transcriptional LysR family regulator
MLENEKIDVAVGDTFNRKPVRVWSEQLQWVVRADVAVTTSAPLPIIMFEDSCSWHGPALAALSGRNVSWKIVCEASTLIAMATAVRVGVGIGSMIGTTIPEDCRVLDRAADLPEPVEISIGICARTGAPREALYLTDFTSRHSSLSRASDLHRA